MKISVVGLGKLGACSAACFAAQGFDVVGVDIDPRAIQAVNAGRAPVSEPGLDELMLRVRGRLRATADYEDAIAGTEITFVVVPTPSEVAGGFSLAFVQTACRSIGRVLRNKRGYHLVVLTSTVLPGSIDRIVRPLLEAESGKVCGTDFGLCYNPEFIALGSVLHDFLNPDFVLIGESDSRAGELLERVYRKTCLNQPPIARMNFVNAELTKIALNTYVTTKIAYANLLAEVCEQLPGANVDVVTRALGHDSRIGPKYLKGGLGYGGPCFPRDNVAFAYLLDQLNVPANLPRAVHQSNLHVPDRIAKAVRTLVGDRPATVGVLGLAYKPNTPVAVESQGVEIARRLAADGLGVVAFDPAAMGEARAMLSGAVHFARSAEELLSQCDIVILATPWPQFASLAWPSTGKSPIVLDVWRMLPAAEGPTRWTLGVGSSRSGASEVGNQRPASVPPEQTRTILERGSAPSE